MNGKVISVVGSTGQGKTSYIKKFSEKLKTKNTVCYLRISDDWNDESIKKFTNFKEFIFYANTQKDTLFIIDEAFTCLPKKLNISVTNPRNMNNQIADFLVNARKLNNFVFIIFHTLQQVPSDWLIGYLDYFSRFSTQDLLQHQIRRFQSFPNIYISLIDYPTIEKYKPIILKLR